MLFFILCVVQQHTVVVSKESSGTVLFIQSLMNIPGLHFTQSFLFIKYPNVFHLQYGINISRLSLTAKIIVCATKNNYGESVTILMRHSPNLRNRALIEENADTITWRHTFAFRTDWQVFRVRVRGLNIAAG
jgi:hypothetical protein